MHDVVSLSAYSKKGMGSKMHLTKTDRCHAGCRIHSTSGRSVTATLLIATSVVVLIGAGQTKRSVDPAAKQVGCGVADVVPADNEVCFSPDECCDRKLVALIRSATESIDVAVYDITLDNVKRALVEASKRVKLKGKGHIAVRVIVDRFQSKGRKLLEDDLLQNDVEVRFGVQKGIMHNKFVIIDKQMVEVGSFNFTENASHRNSENQVYLRSQVIVKRYTERFQKLWMKAKPL